MEQMLGPTQQDERLPWKKPSLEKLDISLDTRDGEGSSTDDATSASLFI